MIRHPFAYAGNTYNEEERYDRNSSIYPPEQYANLQSFMPITSEESLYDWSQPSTYRQLLEDDVEDPPVPAWRRIFTVLKKRATRGFQRLRDVFRSR